MKSLAELGGVLAMAKAGQSAADFTATIAGAGIKQAECQAYIDLAHKMNGTKPTARRVNKSTRQSDSSENLYCSI